MKQLTLVLILSGLMLALGYAQQTAQPSTQATGQQAPTTTGQTPQTGVQTQPQTGQTAAPGVQTQTQTGTTGTGQTTTDQKQPPSGIGALLQSPLMLILLMFVIFYFVLFVPRQRERKKQAELIAALKPGQRVMVMGGLYGTITRMKDTSVMVKVAEGLEVEIDRTAVSMKGGGEQK